MNIEPITLTESARLVALECEIEKGRKTFVEVGLALAEIRDNRLYRSDYGTFEQYCQEKWGFKKSYAYQIIDSASVAKSMSAVADIGSERAARELAKVSPALRAEVVEKAAATGKVTAKSIREASEPVHLEEEKPRIKTMDEEFSEAMGNMTIREIQLQKIKTIKSHMVAIELHIEDEDLTGDDYLLLGAEIKEMGRDIIAIGQKVKELEKQTTK